MSEQDWMVVGTRVFVIGRADISLSTITKVTATQLVTTKGSRYSRKSLVRRLGEYEIESIAPLTDPAALVRFRAQQVSRLAANVAVVAAQFKTDPTEETASAVEAAVGRWRDAAGKL